MEMIESRLSDKPMTDTELREALLLANVPTLLLVLFRLTGDRKWIGRRYQCTPALTLDDHDTGGLDPDLQAEVRDSAFDAIRRHQAGTPIAVPDVSAELLQEMMSVSTGEAVPIEYAGMAHHMLQRGAELAEALREDVSSATERSVLIIGAGIAGITAAIKLQSIGVPFRIIEKSAALGGTWFDNKYPGCGVDTPNHLYSYSFTSPFDWTEYFCRGDELRRYVETVAEEFGIVDHITFNTEAVRLEYDESNQIWHANVRSHGGDLERIEADVVISAVGIFNPPVVISINNLEVFQGKVVHTAAWPDDLRSLAGLKVGVVGSGASAMQLAPAIVDEVESLTLFQRTPQWSIPLSEKWSNPIPVPLRRLMQEVEEYTRWYRIRIGWMMNDRNFDQIQKDPTWPHPERSLNQANENTREFLTAYIESQLSGRPDLIAKSVPRYPPFGKRMLVDHGWYQTLIKPNVHLENDPIARAYSDGVETVSGQRYPLDLLIMATGFDVLNYLSVFEVQGRDGVALRDLWGVDDGKAYLGVAIPGFPNFFCLYGPNSQPAHGGSYFGLAEMQTEFVLSAIQQMMDRDLGSIEIKQEVLDDFVRDIDAANERMVWTHPGMSTYYRNSKGRVVVNVPYRYSQFERLTRSADMAQFSCEPRRQRRALSLEQDQGAL